MPDLDNLRERFATRSGSETLAESAAGSEPLSAGTPSVRERICSVSAPLLGVSQPDVQSARTYRRFQLSGRALGDDPSVVYHGDAVG